MSKSQFCRLFCGYNKTIRVFDTSRPGREFRQHSTVTSSTDGQTGMLSCYFDAGFNRVKFFAMDIIKSQPPYLSK